MKGLLFLILSLPLATLAQEPSTADTFPVEDRVIPNDPQAYEEFVQKLDQFNRKLGGCPKTGHAETCYAPSGTYDAKLWKDLCSRAAKIFHFPRPNNK